MRNRFGIFEEDDFQDTCQMSVMYDWQSTLEDFPKAKRQINKPLYQVHMDSFSSSFKSIEGYNHVFVDAAAGYGWIYGLKSKNGVIKALREWYSDIADLRTKHKLVVLMLDHASEYKSEEMMQFLESRGISSHFSTLKEQWQNSAAESTINSIMMSAQTVMAESGLGGRFWFKAASAGKDARNKTFKEEIRTMLHQAIYGKKRDMSDFRAFCCRAWVYLDKHTPRAKEAIYVGFANNMSQWALWTLEDKKIMTSNQVKFSEHEFPFQTRKMVDQFLLDNITDILYQHASNVTWVHYKKLHVSNYEKVHYDTVSDLDVLKVMSKEKTYTSAIQDLPKYPLLPLGSK
jgi:hypothetical protein